MADNFQRTSPRSGDSTMTPLQPGEMLQWFRIESVLGKGGFGITYLATDTNLDHLVAIKEYAPDLQVDRAADQSLQPVSSEVDESYQTGLTRFISEARTLVKFNHPNIVRILTVFPANNSAYLVMDFEEGEVFSQYIKTHFPVDEQRLKDIINNIIDGLAQVHEKGFLHRDIKPGNIIIRPDGNPVLLDFGCARPSLMPDTNTQTAFVSPGYSPLEQFHSIAGLEEGPWTDIYALSATLHFAITQQTPTNSASRLSAISSHLPDPLTRAAAAGAAHYSERFLQAIDWGLQPTIADRPQSLSAWREVLCSTNTLQPALPPDDDTVLYTRPPTTPADPQPDTGTVLLPKSLKTARTSPPTHAPAYEDDAAFTSGTTNPAEPWDELVPTRHPRPPQASSTGTGIAVAATVALLVAGGGGYLWYADRPSTDSDLQANLPEAPIAETEPPLEVAELDAQIPAIQARPPQHEAQNNSSNVDDSLSSGISAILTEARQATARGHWQEAIEKFREATAIDAENSAARTGATESIAAWLQSIEQDIVNGRLQDAHNEITLAEDLLGKQEKLQQLKTMLSTSEQERIAQLAEQQRIEQERKQAQLADQQRVEQERKKAQIAEQQRIEQERKQAQLAEQQRIEQERKQAQLAEQQRIEQERKQVLLAEQQRIEQERKQAQLAEQQRIEQERKQAQIAEQQRIEQERKQVLLAEQQRIEQERKQAQLAKQQRIEQERKQAQLAEQQRMSKFATLLAASDSHLNSGDLEAAQVAIEAARQMNITDRSLTDLTSRYEAAMQAKQSAAKLSTVDAIREADKRFQQLATAVMNRNEKAIDLLTEGDHEKMDLMKSIFDRYKQIDVEISNIERSDNADAVSAVLSFERLSLPDGTTTIPSSTWRHHSIKIEHHGTAGWSKIQW